MVYLHETVKMKPGKTQAYLEALRKVYLPSAKKRGLTLVACMRTPQGSALEERLVLIWSVPDWPGWTQFRGHTASEPVLPKWLDLANGLRDGVTRELYESAPLSP